MFHKLAGRLLQFVLIFWTSAVRELLPLDQSLLIGYFLVSALAINHLGPKMSVRANSAKSSCMTLDSKVQKAEDAHPASLPCITIIGKLGRFL